MADKIDMTREVSRYNLDPEKSGFTPALDGEWVVYSDFKDLEEERDEAIRCANMRRDRLDLAEQKCAQLEKHLQSIDQNNASTQARHDHRVAMLEEINKQMAIQNINIIERLQTAIDRYVVAETKISNLRGAWIHRDLTMEDFDGPPPVFKASDDPIS